MLLKCTFDVQESSSDEVMDVTSRLSSTHIDKVSSSPAALKLPPLFSLTPNSTSKSGNFYKRQTQVHTNHSENVSEKLPHEPTASTSQVYTPQTGNLRFDPSCILVHFGSIIFYFLVISTLYIF